jgi:hypothetical protein
MKLTQCDVILKAMLENKDIKVWTAKDFQSGKHFVGYEASARMSDLTRLHPDLFIIGKEGRFRTLSVNWEQEKEIDELLKKYNLN